MSRALRALSLKLLLPPHTATAPSQGIPSEQAQPRHQHSFPYQKWPTEGCQHMKPQWHQYLLQHQHLLTEGCQHIKQRRQQLPTGLSGHPPMHQSLSWLLVLGLSFQQLSLVKRQACSLHLAKSTALHQHMHPGLSLT